MMIMTIMMISVIMMEEKNRKKEKEKKKKERGRKEKGKKERRKEKRKEELAGWMGRYMELGIIPSYKATCGKPQSIASSEGKCKSRVK